jgi:pyruvate dehydrogenase E2 component (dihydrolipoamide acetyltransferase)
LTVEGAKGAVTVQEPTTAERAVGRHAAEARATVPDLELSVAAAPGFTAAALVSACAHALAAHPRANASYRDGRFELYTRANVGIVVATELTYTIPTIFDADRKSTGELAAELEELTAGAREGTLPSPAFTGATFTLWDARPHGIAAASIPVVPPQAAALAAGTASLTLSCDHRILYGAVAAAFLQTIAHHLDGDRV